MAETAATHGFACEPGQVNREALLVIVLTWYRADPDYFNICSTTSISGFPSKADC